MKRPFKLAAMMFFLLIFGWVTFIFIVNGFNFNISWWDVGARVMVGLMFLVSTLGLTIAVYNCTPDRY